MEVGKFTGWLVGEDDEMPRVNSVDPIKFTYNKSASKISIAVFEEELNWIHSISDSVKDLDKITKQLNRGIRSKNLLVKRDSVEAADRWCEALQDKTARLSYSTMGEVLATLIEDPHQLVKVVSKMSLLSKKSGLVSLNRKEYEIILTHYHFQLIYTKMILGIVIASKISI